MRVCPKCGSKNLSYFEEYCVTRYYKLDKDNEPTKEIISESLDSVNMPYNFRCEECGEIFGGTAERSD